MTAINRKSSKSRIIFHIDMNCFYAACEIAHNPTLQGKPLAIAGNPKDRKGIIITSSYEAREKDIKTTMPLWEAYKLCPDLIVLPPHFERYREMSTEIFKRLNEVTSQLEPVSIDEGYMDITDVCKNKNAITLATQIQQKLLNELNMPCSIGIGPNKFLAKTASDMKKPLGITVLRIRDIKRVLWPLPVEQMHGIGSKTAQKLQKLHIKTIQDLAQADVYQITQLLGVMGERLIHRANGIDKRKVDPDAAFERKSVGSSQTLPYDTTDQSEIDQRLRGLASKVEDRLMRKDLVGMGIQITIRYSDRKTITRSKKLTKFINDKQTIFTIANEIFWQHWNKKPIRLLGITVFDVNVKSQVGHQLDLFSYEKEERSAALRRTTDHLIRKYGESIFK